MSEHDNALAVNETARLAEWRNERARVAEEQKTERLRKRDEARALLDAEKRTQRRALARALLPQPDELERAHKALMAGRRRALMWLTAEFALIVALPLVVFTAYLVNTATPLYEAQSVVAITKPSASGTASAQGLIGLGDNADNLGEVFMADTYIKSESLLEELETRYQLRTRLSGAEMDPLRRLYSRPHMPFSLRTQFNRFVESSVDVQTGLLRVYVRLPDPAEAVAVSHAILDLAAGQINTLNDALLQTRLSQTDAAVVQAKADLFAAQETLVGVQIASGDIDPKERVRAIYASIGALEAEVMTLHTAVQRGQIAGIGGSTQVRQSEALMQGLREQITAQRQLLVTKGDDNSRSLTEALMDYEIAALRVRIAEESVSAALAAQTEASQAAALGRSLFQIVVPPRTEAQPSSPRTLSDITLAAVLLLAAFAVWRMIRGGARSGLGLA